MTLEADQTILQGTLGLGAEPMPVIHPVRTSIGVADQQVYAIGITAPHQGEQGPVIALVASQPAMREQLETSVIAFYHDQGLADLDAVCQQKFIS